ncbi:type II toxin-antitoxin system HipA family toxin [Catonella massiliensis]|uniref:Type II toxin-antitoxin system HipA family toxin n=1 Tax=Catonella massiliensis TaxID=2799636 RepID=A0ABS1IWE1_9FIRM|nr:type II toxin-antitoxin system HipA family toxin [Catonella massiliensis]MBK5896206.1 type II toxin-antitoxin system HipA family toxin [Catonella massiliensis]
MKIQSLKVNYGDREVGTLALYKDYFAAFQYSKDWLKTGFSISPFSLPLKEDLFIPKMEPFDGLFGVFNDSLPDGWGRLLVDRLMLKNKINPAKLGNLERLSIVGDSGMGALNYKPMADIENNVINLDLDELCIECSNLLNTEYSSELDELFILGGSSGGARPKILTTIEDKDYIIKFHSKEDNKNIGKLEYDYSLCAKACGIEMPETRLFPSRLCSGYFGVERFDRLQTPPYKMHMVSVSGLLETSHRLPNLDYNLLMRLTLELTKDISECKKLYRLMCFNVFAHNRDDHSKNFSYIYLEDEKRWILSPAYDLTYSNSLGGEHATTVDGEGANPDITHLINVAKNIGISIGYAKAAANEIREVVNEMLGEYL